MQEEDLVMLNSLAKQEVEEEAIKTARRERARAEAAWMKEVTSEFVTFEIY